MYVNYTIVDEKYIKIIEIFIPGYLVNKENSDFFIKTISPALLSNRGSKYKISDDYTHFRKS